MAVYALTLTSRDNHGITTATSWEVGEEAYNSIMSKALELFGPSHGLIANPGGATEITRAVRDHSVEF